MAISLPLLGLLPKRPVAPSLDSPLLRMLQGGSFVHYQYDWLGDPPMTVAEVRWKLNEGWTYSQVFCSPHEEWDVTPLVDWHNGIPNAWEGNDVY